MTKEQQAFMMTLPVLHRPGYAKAIEGSSLAAAIKAKCRECCGHENAAVRVKECNITTCPLWPHRR